jgi:hypothetical protein
MAGKPGRNDPCHCGSGKKYKRCCLDADAAATSAVLAAERDRLNDEKDLFDDADLSDEDVLDADGLAEDDWDPAPPFERKDVLLVNYKRGLAHNPDQIGSGQGFEVTEWMAPDIPGEVLDAFEREAVWELDGWWGDSDVADPVQFDLITVQSTRGEAVIEVQNRDALLAMGGEIEDLASITRVCSALERAAKRGTGRSWISQEDGDDDAFEDGTRYDPEAGPDPAEWLLLSEVERIERIRSWHATRHVHLAKPGLHAAAHAVVENQIALQIPEVLDALYRLRSEGLSRHDAVHAIGLALTEEVLPALQADLAEHDLNASYHARLKRLTAAEWRRLGEEAGEHDG